MRPGSLYQLTFPEISIRQCVSLFSARRSPTWFRWRKSGRRAESDSGGDGLLANPRIVARRRFQTSGRRHRNRSCGFCCFSPSKSREKSFPKFYAESLRGFREVAVPTNFFLLVLLGPKVPKASARRSPRECVSRGATRGAQDQAYAPPRDGRAAARPLFFRVKRECGFVVPPLAAFFLYGNAPLHSFFPQGDPRLGSDGGKADGRLKAPAAGTVCLQTRAVARRRFQSSGRRHRNRSGGFCCFSTPKSREKSFFRRFFRKPKKDVERLFAAFRHRKAGKKERVFQAFFCKEQKDIGRLLATYTRKNNQQRILPYSKAPIPSICRANSLRAVRS